MKRGPQNNANQQGRNIKARTEDFTPHTEQHQYACSQNDISIDLKNQQANVILTSFQVTIERAHERIMNRLSAEDQEKINTLMKDLKI